MTRALSRRWPIFCLCTALALLAWPQPRTAAQSAGEVVRTADINLRGLTRRDFPRMQKLADNVYVFPAVQTRTDIEMEFTTNNLVVVTRDGVLVADGQIDTAGVRQLLAEIAKITPQPVKYVVVGSDHKP